MFVMSRGFPRPRTRDGNLPVPYVAVDDDSIATLDFNRDPECTFEGLCQMCGLGFELDELVSIAKNDAGEVIHDHGLTHIKCAVIVSKFCPAFSETGANGVHLHMETTTLGEALKLIDHMVDKYDYLSTLRVKKYNPAKYRKIEK